MDYYNFIVRKVDNQFVSIITDNASEVVSIGIDKSLYSILVTDEPTARLNFTATGHLPNEVFEALMSDAKE